MLGIHTRARSLAWLERPADNREVSSSNLVGPTITSPSVVFQKTILSLYIYLSVHSAIDTVSEPLWRPSWPTRSRKVLIHPPAHHCLHCAHNGHIDNVRSRRPQHQKSNIEKRTGIRISACRKRFNRKSFWDQSLWQVQSSPHSHSQSSSSQPQPQPQSSSSQQQSSSQQHPKTASSYSWIKSCAPIHSTTAT